MAKHTIEIDMTTEQETAFAQFLALEDNARFSDLDDWLAEAVGNLMEGVFRRSPTAAIEAEKEKKRLAEAEVKRLSRPNVKPAG